MEKLPTEIEENILDRLTIEAALPAKQVCKTWRIFLRTKTDKVGLLFAFTYKERNENKLSYGDQYDNILGKMNYNYSYDRLDKMPHGKILLEFGYIENMIGSCNGLVCFGRQYGDSGNPFLICNPFTGDVVNVPKPDKSIARDCFPSGISGFGYCHSTNEYKIVSMHREYKAPKKYHVLVYTIGGGGGWRSKASIHICPLYPLGVYANGALHWLFLNNINEQHRGYTIMALDLEDEKFKFIDLPHFEDIRRYNIVPKLLGGNNLYLVFSTVNKYQPAYCTDIWAYKREITTTAKACDLKANYNDKNSWHWIKEYSIEWEEPFLKDISLSEPLALTRNNEFLLRYRCRTIYCYDIKTSTLHKLFDGPATDCSMINVIPHANSILPMPLKGEEVQDHQ